MYLPPKDNKNTCLINGLKGLPEDYPTPEVNDMLFYIQRNQNKNTVIYKVNRGCNNCVSLDNPIDIFWIRYQHNGGTSPINDIQKKLAYGIDHQIINNDTILINLVSYPQYKIYITSKNDNTYEAVSKINGTYSILSNVYVFAEENGAFPIVKYLELYGIRKSDGFPCFEKIII